MRLFSLFAGLVLGAWFFPAAAAVVEPEAAELNFDTQIEKAGALLEAHAPKWVTKVEQRGGHFYDDPACWYVPATEPKGTGRLAVVLDRKQIDENLVATILFDAEEGTDLAVQLFDAQGRVVQVDLFGNLVDVGREAMTNTLIIPLRKYPTADSIVIRRISGEVKVYGMVLFPAVTEGEPNLAEIKKLAAVLGDPLSPENPLVKGLQDIAKKGKVAIEPVRTIDPPLPAPAPVSVVPVTPNAPVTPPVRGVYAAAVLPAPGAPIAPPPTLGLVGFWNFDAGAPTDLSGRNHDGQIRGGAQLLRSLRGNALRTRRNPSTARVTRWDCVTIAPNADLDLKETMTVAAWINYASIAATWGSQIAWFGDSQFGRDPWELHLHPDGTVEFRSDRSVTGKPRFTIFSDELKLSPKGEPMPNQHVRTFSPKTLAPDTWYFVAGTIERISPQKRALKLFVNGDLVGEVTTDETVNYPTEKMHMTIGAVDDGTWQNFDGQIDDVRVYNRALSPPEIKTLCQQPLQ